MASDKKNKYSLVLTFQTLVDNVEKNTPYLFNGVGYACTWPFVTKHTTSVTSCLPSCTISSFVKEVCYKKKKKKKKKKKYAPSARKFFPFLG